MKSTNRTRHTPRLGLISKAGQGSSLLLALLAFGVVGSLVLGIVRVDGAAWQRVVGAVGGGEIGRAHV